MGLFDFLKGRAKAPSRKATRESIEAQSGLDRLGNELGGRPRFWHHFLCHVALRDFALNGDGLPEDAWRDAPAFFAHILERMAPHLGIETTDAKSLVADIAVHRRRIGDRDAAIVKMPRPQGPTECHFVCLMPRSPQHPTARYFTLEDAGGGVTVLGGWTADERHEFFDDDVSEPTLAVFAELVSRRA